MENRITAALKSFLQPWLDRIAGVLALVLAGCASDAPAHVPTTSHPPPSVSTPQKDSLKLANPTAPDLLFPLGQSRPLFDGTSLQGWKITEFGGHGDVTTDKSIKGSPALIFEQGAALTGVTWTNAIPQMNYEVELDGIKLLGSDFFCGLTFPFADSFCTFVCGGWGGAVVGVSSVDGQDASQNETTKFMKFDENRWYHIKVRVTPGRIETWIDAEKMVDLETTGKKISMRLGEIEESEPFGIASYQTRAGLRNITLRRLAPSQ